MEFSENASMKPPRGEYASLEVCLFDLQNIHSSYKPMRSSVSREVNYENIRLIGSEHCIGEYFVLSNGDGCPSYAR